MQNNEQEVFLYDYDYCWSIATELGEKNCYNPITAASSKEKSKIVFINWIRNINSFPNIKRSEHKFEDGNVYIKLKFLTICTTTQKLLDAVNTKYYIACEIINVVEEWIKICTMSEFALDKFEETFGT